MNVWNSPDTPLTKGILVGMSSAVIENFVVYIDII